MLREPGGAPAEGLFQRLLDRLPTGAYLCDPDGLITYFNEQAVRVWGRAPKLRDPIDRFCGSFRLFTPAGAPLAHDRCWMALALTQKREYNGEEIIVERPDGRRLHVLAHANPIRDDAGTLIGAVNVLVDISDHKRAEAALEEADRAKSEFLATVSHEIRTPINAILGYLDLLHMELQGPLNEGQRNQLSRVRSASEHLLSLINQVLDFSRLEAAQLVVRGDALRAADSAAAAVSVVHPLASARGVALRLRAPAGSAARYIGDEDRVRQMLVNLLSNAIKFSEPGGAVELSWESCARPGIPMDLQGESGRWLRFRVRDGGPGIPAEHLSRIFEPFVQLESSRTRTRGGTGLGLTISRRLAREMGGDLCVDSAVGEGSTFTLWLPGAELHTPGEDDAVEPADHDQAVTSGGGQPFLAAGNALLSGMDHLLHAYVDRLRAESLGPGSASLADGRLSSHAAILIAQIAVCLRSLDSASADTAVLELGAEVLRACATDHGRQRASFGWSEHAVARELDILSEELVRHARTRLGRDLPAPVAGVIRSRVEQAKAFSIQALATPA